MVNGGTVHQRIGRRRTVGEEETGGRAVLAGFVALVAFDDAVGLPLGLAFLPDQLDAVHTAFDFVDVAEVVDLPRPPRNAAGGIGADPVGGQWDELLIVGGLGRCGQQAAQGAEGDQAGDKCALQGCVHGVVS